MNNIEVKQQLLLRVPARSAYEAFADPEVTTRFWFTHSNGRLEPGAERLWEWRMYGVATKVHVLAAIPGERILLEWGEPEKRSKVEWTFEPRSEATTMVTIRNFDLMGTEEERIAEALGSMGGFSLVLAACKAFLEHGIELQVVADHAPEAHVTANESRL